MSRIVFAPSSGMRPAGRGLFAGASALNNQHHLALQTVPKGVLMGCGCQHQLRAFLCLSKIDDLVSLKIRLA